MELNDYQENYGNGWIKLYRSIDKHWIWQDSIKLKWWLDILLTVNHSGKKVNIGYEIFDCNPGQSVLSLQNWALRWDVSKDTVRNFFTLLKKDNMIILENLKKTTRITVCNYAIYQHSLHDEQTQSKRKANAKQTQSYPNKKDKNVKNDNNKIIDFYQNEINQNKDGEYIFEYTKIYEFMMGKNDLSEKLNNVLNIPEQITYKQYVSLYIKSKEKGKKISNMLLTMDNKKEYCGQRSSLAKTLHTWINNDFK